MATMTLRGIARSVALVGTLTLATAAHAQEFFFNRAQFVAALATTQTNDLNALANGSTVIPFGALGTGTLTGATVSGGLITKPGAPFSLTINFSQLIRGFGADYANLAAATSVGGEVTLFNGATQVGSITFGSTPSPSTFFGFIPSGGAFNRAVVTDAGSIRVGNASVATTFVSIDNPVIGVQATVPEPATIALMATGLLAVGGVARRRARTS